MSLILAEPIGSPFNLDFTFQDLLDVNYQFGTTQAYFSAPDVICFPNPRQPATQECSTKPEANPFVTMPGLPYTSYTVVVPPPNQGPPPHMATPEPQYQAMILVMFLFLIIGLRGKGAKR